MIVLSLTRESAKIDYVRGWVHRNSLHLIDNQHDEYAWRNHLVIRKLWEAHEGSGSLPHFNITYERVGSGLRVNLHQMLFDNLESVEPVNQGFRGWEALSVPGLKRYFKVGIYAFEYDGGRSVAIINRARLVPARTYATASGPLKIEEYLFKYRNQPTVLYESLR